MNCARCLARVALVAKLCALCHASDFRRAEAKKRANFKDPFGAIRNGEGKGIPKATLPLGAVVIRKDGAHESRFVKIRMDGESGKRWTPFARWWWEKNKGPIPPGHLVLHKDGDLLNDHHTNLMTGTPGMKLVLAHERDLKWSRDQHARAARACAERNRKVGQINRSVNFLKNYWYPVVDDLGVILNVPFRKRRRMLASFGVDVSRYPLNGHGKHQGSMVQRAIRSCVIRPVKSAELSLRRYLTYCLLDPVSKECQGPLSMSTQQLAATLERMGIWQAAQKYAKKDLRDRR